jgi:hypothetical protein
MREKHAGLMDGAGSFEGLILHLLALKKGVNAEIWEKF